MSSADARIVSSEDEPLILVDEDDKELGFLSKAECHDGGGILHRAFSVFLFNEAGELLLQRRSGGKRLWPMYWSNSCCSHPRKGESFEAATRRRLQDELNVSANIEFVYRFVYHAQFGDIGSEHENCHVFLGRLDNPARPNATEIESLRFVSAHQLDTELVERPDEFTPWLKLEWQELKGTFGPKLATYTGVV